MLDDWIIAEIKRKEQEKREEDNRPRAELTLDEPPEDQTEDEDKPKRGVEIISLL